MFDYFTQDVFVTLLKYFAIFLVSRTNLYYYSFDFDIT